MIANPNAPSYSECIHEAVADLGTAQPHIQVLRLVSSLYDVPLAMVRQDCQEMWLRLRRAEADKGGSRGQQGSR